MATLYANTLGTPAAKNKKYRAYKTGEIYTIYSVCPELIWMPNGEVKFGRKLEAIQRGFVRDIENFEAACMDLDAETYWLMKEGA